MAKKGKKKEKQKEKQEGKPVKSLLVSEDSGGDYPRLEPGEYYVAKFTGVEEKEGKWGPYLIWSFEFVPGTVDEEGDEIGEGTTMNMMTDYRLEPSRNTWPIATVLAGGELEIGDDFKPTEYVGKKYRVFVDDGEKNRDDGTPYQNITKIKPFKKSKKSKKKKSKK